MHAISLRVTAAMHSCRMLLLIDSELIVFQALSRLTLSGEDFMSSQAKQGFEVN